MKNQTEQTAMATFEQVAEMTRLLDSLKDRNQKGLAEQVLDLNRIESGKEAGASEAIEVHSKSAEELRLYIAYWQAIHRPQW